MARDPGRSGLGVIILVAITIPVTYAAVVWSVQLFPAGRYPQIVLMMPGMLLGGLFFVVASVPVYLLQHRKAAPETTPAARLSNHRR